MVTTEVEFLGNTVSRGTIYPNKKRAAVVRQKPKPETLKELHR